MKAKNANYDKEEMFMNIGLLGADDLCKRNEIIFSEIDCETLLIHKETEDRKSVV